MAGCGLAWANGNRFVAGSIGWSGTGLLLACVWLGTDLLSHNVLFVHPLGGFFFECSVWRVACGIRLLTNEPAADTSQQKRSRSNSGGLRVCSANSAGALARPADRVVA